MSDLEFFELPLGNIKLERLDVWNKRHIKAVRGLRDINAKKFCYDLKGTVEDEKSGRGHCGNSFLVKDKESDEYVGYIYISNEHPGNERVLSYIIQKKMRGMGYGKIILTMVSDFLFEYGLADKLTLYINKDNIPGIKLATGSGFKRMGFGYSEKIDEYSRKN